MEGRPGFKRIRTHAELSGHTATRSIEDVQKPKEIGHPRCGQGALRRSSAGTRTVAQLRRRRPARGCRDCVRIASPASTRSENVDEAVVLLSVAPRYRKPAIQPDQQAEHPSFHRVVRPDAPVASLPVSRMIPAWTAFGVECGQDDCLCARVVAEAGQELFEGAVPIQNSVQQPCRGFAWS